MLLFIFANLEIHSSNHGSVFDSNQGHLPSSRHICVGLLPVLESTTMFSGVVENTRIIQKTQLG